MTFEEQNDYSDYSEVPVMRKRWFFVLCVLIFIPLGIVLAFTGEMYVLHKGKIYKYPRGMRIGMAVMWLVMVLLGVVQIIGY